MEATDEHALPAAALSYARQGVPVFPVHYIRDDGVCSCGGPEANPKCKPGKHPITPSGHKSATTDQEIVRAWWFKDPEANIGTPTGAGTGLLVLDGDGEEGVGTLQQFGYPEDAPRVRTGSGGLHVHVRYPRDREVGNGVRVAPGLDVRGKGGFVILPPSRNADGSYGWEVERGGSLPDTPAWFLSLIRRKDGEPGERFDTARALAGVPEGERDSVLWSFACKLRSTDIPEDVAERLVCEAAANCDPPFEEDKAREKVNRAYRAYEPNSSDARPKQAKPTHDELADRWLAKHLGERAHGQGEWKRYEGGIWLPVPDAAVKRGVKAVLVAAKTEEIKPTAALLASVVEFARVEVAVPDEDWDADPDILVCANGTLHVPTRNLREHRMGDHATSSVPYDYDPKAVAPTWGRFLGDFVDAETAHFLQEFSGYCLTTDVSHELALWLYGPPGGGRSTFIAGLEAMLGERTGTLGLRGIERSQFALANIPGKTLLTATEQPAGFVRSSDVLNALISGDRMEVEKKYKDAYRVYPRAKLLWAMNDLPRLQSASDGLFRRVKVVRIEPVPEGQRDPKVKDGIKDEGAGILNWALDGLARLRERGGFQVPDTVRDATGQWQTTNDTAALFVAKECEREPGERTRANALYRRYRSWCEENGHRPKAHTNIAEDWERLGFERLKSGGRTYWLGVRVRDPVVMTP